MICVAEIKLIETSKEEFIFSRMKNSHSGLGLLAWDISDPEKLTDPIEVTEEMVKGETFCTANGDTICIGMTKEVQTAIGLPFNEFDSLRERLYQNHLRIMDAERERYNVERRINRFKNLGYWKRLLAAARNTL